ncbi:MAG: aspartate-semialdehyde dehydrogenase [Bacteriovoracaceae bacterium]|nr:aspartate-semialdehyde dehydrogenase [Bacteriovoracaceae bacterium]
MKTPIAILGATGTVGQKIITMMKDHPLFEITQLVASSKNVGKCYEDAVIWREKEELPKSLCKIKLISFEDVTATYALSSLPSDVAQIQEMELAKRGIHVVSNASAYRMAKNVPLIIPEINADHIGLIKKQDTKGKIITNPNCATVFLSLGILPLLSVGEVKHISTVTLQAVSGAGYPGVPSIDLIGDTIPNIGGEEEKVESESKKILGGLDRFCDFSITSHVNRVPVAHGHTVAIHAYFASDVTVEQVQVALLEKMKQFPDLYKYHQDPFRPRPRLDLDPLDQRAHIGRLKQGDAPNIVGLVSMGHNLVRGAAGAAKLNLELLHKTLKN